MILTGYKLVGLQWEQVAPVHMPPSIGHTCRENSSSQNGNKSYYSFIDLSMTNLEFGLAWRMNLSHSLSTLTPIASYSGPEEGQVHQLIFRFSHLNWQKWKHHYQDLPKANKPPLVHPTALSPSTWSTKKSQQDLWSFYPSSQQAW